MHHVKFWTLLFLIFPPPVCQIYEFSWKLFSEFCECIIAWVWFIEDFRTYEFCQSICEDFCICFSDIFPDISKSRSTLSGRLKDKNHPFFTKEHKQILSMWTTTLWMTNHKKRQSIKTKKKGTDKKYRNFMRSILMSFFFKAKLFAFQELFHIIK